MLLADFPMPTSTADIAPVLAKAVEGGRLSPDEGLALLGSHDLIAIGQAAEAFRSERFAQLRPKAHLALHAGLWLLALVLPAV